MKRKERWKNKDFEVVVYNHKTDVYGSVCIPAKSADDAKEKFINPTNKESKEVNKNYEVLSVKEYNY